MNVPGTSETAEIKSEIERTRVEMSETLGEIQERLRPDHLIQQAKDTVADAASGKVRYKVDRPGVISGYSTPTLYEPANGPKQIIIPE